MTTKPLITGLVPERKAGHPVLSRHERIVLSVVLRFPDRAAITERIDGERQMTRAQWADARRQLIAKRLLSHTGELTAAGREAVDEAES
jgi:hypothetical protein